jgi:hypothetical protein
MKRSISILRCLVLVLSLLLIVPYTGFASDSQAPAAKVENAGKISANPIDLKVSLEKAKDAPPVVKLKAAKDAYVTAIYFSDKGDATVLLPNREVSDCRFQQGKEYRLFGPESGVKLAADEKQKKAKIVFYVSPVPVKLDPLAIPQGQDFITISGASEKELSDLCGKLEAASKEDGFNRKVLALKASNKDDAYGLMGLPSEAKSGRPQNVTGVQGLKGNILDSSKD